MTGIRRCEDHEKDAILGIVNAAAEAYRDVIPADCWQEPYMPSRELEGHRLVHDAREALATDAGWSLPELARELGVSAHHLSRVFHAHTGHTISRYRLLLRGRTALERIAGGERNVARLAADLGFSDQSHLCRVLRGQTGQTPATLRKLLA